MGDFMGFQKKIFTHEKYLGVFTQEKQFLIVIEWDFSATKHAGLTFPELVDRKIQGGTPCLLGKTWFPRYFPLKKPVRPGTHGAFHTSNHQI